MKPPYTDALRRTRVLDLLHAFDPHVAGTPPLGLALPSSDIDVLCFAPNLTAFAERLWAAFRDQRGFALRQWVRAPRAVIGRFTAEGWQFELFGEATPVALQAGWRHFAAERRLLTLGGAAFRAAVLRERHAGAKTEPAFARVLDLPGDPYDALLELDRLSDAAVRTLLVDRGFGAG